MWGRGKCRVVGVRQRNTTARRTDGWTDGRRSVHCNSLPERLIPRGARHSFTFIFTNDNTADLFLGEVREAGEDENADGDEHHEQAELLVAAPQSVAERLQADRVTRQLQYPQDPHDAEDLHETAVLQFWMSCWCGRLSQACRQGGVRWVSAHPPPQISKM